MSAADVPFFAFSAPSNCGSECKREELNSLGFFCVFLLEMKNTSSDTRAADKSMVTDCQK